MTQLRKLRTRSVLKWVSLNFIENHFKSQKNLCLFMAPIIPIGQNPRLYATERSVQTEHFDETTCQKATRISPKRREQAKAALLEYLHSTRSLEYMDADKISKNSPNFLENLVRKAQLENDDDIRRSLARYLRYHPINEFKPFFESLGLKPIEYAPLLSHGMIFLSDDLLSLENYRVLFNYGFSRDKIGKIYKDASGVFKYEFGVLHSDLQALEKLGFSQGTVRNLIANFPRLLIGEMKVEFFDVVGRLKSIGFELSWIEKFLLEHGSLNCRLVRKILNAFEKMGCSQEDLFNLITRHPDFLSNALSTLSVIDLLLKFGIALDDMPSIFLRFQEIQVGNFLLNFNKSIVFLNEIDMDPNETAKIICAHPVLLGSITLKKASSLLYLLNVGKKRLRQHVKENPEEMKKWVMGSKTEPLPGDKETQQMLKTKFLLGLGFDSDQIEKAHKVFKGKGAELQERFDCIVNAGLETEDVTKIVRAYPHILNLRKDVIKTRIEFLVNDLGLPLSTLLTFPIFVCFTTKRVKLRWLMYNWLKDEGNANPTLTLPALVNLSDILFIGLFVNKHSKGPEQWQRLKKEIQLENNDDVLHSDLRALEKLGVSHDKVPNFIEIVRVVKRLKRIGFEIPWIEKHLLEHHGSLNCQLVRKILNVFGKMGCSREYLCRLISRHPDFLTDALSTLSIINLLCQFGIMLDEMRPIFHEFPEIQVEIFVLNFKKSLLFLNEIEMDPNEIAKIVRAHPTLLGSCTLKKASTLLSLLNVGKKRLCQYIIENPSEMKKFVMGSKVEPLPRDPPEKEIQRTLKTEFLLRLGFDAGSKLFKGKGTGLQERFDCIVKAGLDTEDVAKIVRAYPLVLELRKDVIKTKIDFLVNDLGLPISTLLRFPSYFSYASKRVKLRWSMYNWLKDEGSVKSSVTLISIVTWSEKQFISHFVNKHPKGLEQWQKFKKEIYSD